VGTIAIPAAGLVYLDAPALIYSLEAHPKYWPLLRPLWQAVKAGQVTLATSELSLLEVLVMPLRRRDEALITSCRKLLESEGMQLFPVSRPVLLDAARLRAEMPALRTPDAIHVATALLAHCALFLTNDRGLRAVPKLPVTFLDQLLDT
jgi:predicted nucleic acid-binding protein